MKNKKIISLILALVLIGLFITACAKENNVNNVANNNTEQSDSVENQGEKQVVKIAALKGPTGMGMAQLFDSQDKNEASNNYDYKILGSPDEAVASFSAGEVDIMAVPANLAATLYNKTEGKVKVAAINTLGVLYITSFNDYEDVSQLKGKTIVASGKGATPEFALRHILKNNGIDPDNDVTIEYKSEQGEVVQNLAANKDLVGALPEPFLTSAMAKNPDLKINFSYSELWDKISENNKTKSKMVTGVVVIRDTFLNENPEAVESFLNDYEKSVSFINNNVEEGAELVGKYEIVPKEVAVKAIPNCNIVFIKGEEMKEALSSYYETLHEMDPRSVGGKMPNEDFYITK